MKAGFRLAGAAALIAALGSIASAENTPRISSPEIVRPQIITQGAIMEMAAERLNVERCIITRLNIEAVPGVAFRAELPIEGQWVSIDMQPHSVRGENYRVLVQQADGSLVEVEPGVERNFRGSVDGVPGSIVAASILDEGLDARVIMPDGSSYMIVPMTRHFLNAGADEYAIFRGEDSLPIGGVCGNDHEHAPPVGEEEGIIDNGTGDCGGLCVAQLGCDADVEYYQDFGSSVTSVENRINTIINQVNPPYESQIGITHQIEAIIVRTAEPDPYSTTNSTTLVGQVRSEWTSGSASSVQHDVAHLFTGKEIDGSTIGEADTIGGICTSQRYAYSQAECCGSTGCAVDLVTHELGHLWGGIHCSCPSNFMTTPLSCSATSFTSSNVANMVNHRNSRTCLDPELSPVSLPFFDNFPPGALGAPLWAASGATSSNVGNGEPSAPNSARIRGTQSLTSAPMNTSAVTDLTVSYWWQRTGSGGNSPENGEDLVVEYRTNSGSWSLLATHPGAGSDTDPYAFASFVISNSDAYHSSFRIRFRNPDGDANADDFFVDDVSVSGTLAFPGSFSLLVPANGATGVTQGPLFLDWSTSANAANYSVQVDDDPGFGSPEINIGATLATQLNIGGTPLTDGVTYFWRVIANNPNGSQNGTPNPASFTIGTPPSPPGAFNLLLPANGATEVSQDPLFFDWADAAGAVTYELDVDNNSNFSSPEIALTGLTLSQRSIGGAPLLEGVTHFWRVRAVNASGTTISTPASSSFTTEAPLVPPGAFGLVSPANGATDVSQDPTLEFDWADSTNADDYDLLVDDNSDFSSPEISLTGLTSSDASVGGSPLADGTAYFWRVIANNGDGSTTSTPASFNFTTETPAAPCPGDVANNDNMVDVDDLNAILGVFNTSVGIGSPLDLANNDGFVDVDDLNVVLGNWGVSCP